MRILQVTPAFPPSALGGVSTHVDLISRELVERGHTVWVATTNRYDTRTVMPFSGLRETNKLRVYYAASYWPGRYFFAPRILVVLRNWIPTFDVVHVHDARTFVGLASYLFARHSSVPYVLSCHGSLSLQVGDTFLKRAHDGLVGRGLAENASALVAVSEKEARDITAFGIPPDRISIIPNTVQIEEPEALHKRARPPLSNKSVKTVLYLGRVHPIKGLDRLVEAFEIVHKRVKETRLLIVGQDYGARVRLEAMVKKLGLTESVEFRPPVQGAQKSELLRDASLLVLPSYNEIFGLVILEAFAAELPVVTTVGCSIAPDLEEAGAGLVVSSAPEMAVAIERCLTDRSLADGLRQGGLSLLRSKYNWQSAFTKLEGVYARLILSRESRRSEPQRRRANQ